MHSCRLAAPAKTSDGGAFPIDFEIVFQHQLCATSGVARCVRLSRCDQHRDAPTATCYAPHFSDCTSQHSERPRMVRRLGGNRTERSVGERQMSRVANGVTMRKGGEPKTQRGIDIDARYFELAFSGFDDDSASSREWVEQRAIKRRKIDEQSRVFHGESAALKGTAAASIPLNRTHDAVAAFQQKRAAVRQLERAAIRQVPRARAAVLSRDRSIACVLSRAWRAPRREVRGRPNGHIRGSEDD
jgi:hypothetical protein